MNRKIVDAWLSAASYRPSENYNLRPEGACIDLLVIHGISLPPGRYGTGYIEKFFTNKLDCSKDPYFKQIAHLQVASHLLIDREGLVVQFVGLDKRAWHAGKSCFKGRTNCNDFSIGIELEGSDTEAYTDKQYAVLVELTLALMREYPQLTPNRIVGHSDIAPGRKTDPGPAFDWDKYLKTLEVVRRDENGDGCHQEDSTAE